MLFTTPELGDHISGAILFEETIRQATDDGARFTGVLQEAGVIPGIKVDTGAKSLALYAGETVTEGLDGLRDRLAEYGELEAHFAKWRATIYIDGANGLPTELSAGEVEALLRGGDAGIISANLTEAIDVLVRVFGNDLETVEAKLVPLLVTTLSVIGIGEAEARRAAEIRISRYHRRDAPLRWLTVFC